MHNLVPHFILNQYAAGERNGRFQATALFVDISGFSAITDALMQHGQHGAEVLATVMNGVFDPLIQSVYERGGFVSGFAGDAFTAVFPDSALHALAAGWTIQQNMGSHSGHDTLYGHFSMTAKVGAAAGEVAWGIVSSEEGQRASYFFQGTAIDGCAAAEKAAGAGDVMLDAALYEQVEEKLSVEAAGDYFRVADVSAPLPAPQPVNLPPPDPELVSRFFPAAVTHSGSSGEFRQVVSLFISLPTVRTEVQLGIFMGTIFDLQERYGGLLNRLDFGDKGANLLLFWGAPISYENDVERALQFVLDLQTQTAIPINGGVTYRIAHAGHIGSALRGEYTCYGRGVNLAARFMTQAPRGEIWLDENAAHRVEAHFDLDDEGEKRFKGFAQPQKVYALFERKEMTDISYTSRFVGRDAELARLSTLTQPIFDGRYAGLILLRGEAGIGKSRLAHDFLAGLQAADSGTPVDFALFQAQSDEILRQSLNPFRYWLRSYFSVSEAVAESRNKRSFNRVLDNLIGRTGDSGLAPELDRTRSCLGALVGLRWPDSLYEQLDAKSRHENTLSALVTLIQAESRQQPVIFLWEDAHWSDEDSSSFAPRLLKELSGYPLAILATARLEGVKLPLEEFAVEELELTGLAHTALAALADSILGGSAAEKLLDLLAERAGGNPFFAEQILRYLAEEELLVETAGGWDLKASDLQLLPVDVQAVLIARLDRLAQEIREVVQTAAVLGREFEVRLLTHMLRDDEELTAKVARAEHEAIWAALSEVRYIFRHALLRDAAYRMQLRARRQSLHALALASLESLYGDNPELHYGEMAHHALAAQLNEPAFQYSIAAGDGAMGIFAMPDAIGHYENARQLLRDGRVGEVNSADVQHLFLQLGRALELLNAFEEAVQIYQGMARLAHERDDQALRLASLVAEGTITALPYASHDIERARLVSREALELARETGDQIAEAKALWNHLLIERIVAEDIALAIEFGEQAAELVRNTQELDLLATILNDLATVYAAAGELDAAEARLLEAEKILRQLNNPSMLGNTYNFLGTLNRDSGQFGRAVAYLEEGEVVTEALGGIRNFPFMSINLSLTLLRQGNYAGARVELENLLALEEKYSFDFLRLTTYQLMALLSLKLGSYEQGIRWCQKAVALNDKVPLFARPPTFAFLARLWLRQGDLPQAQAALADSLVDYDPHNTMPGVWSYRTVPQAQVEIGLELGEIAQAEAAAGEMLAVLERLNYRGHMVEAWLMQALVDLARDRIEETYTALRKGWELAETMGERQDSWRILWELSRLEAAAGKHREAERHRQQAKEVVTYIAEHAGSAGLRASFVDLPEVGELLAERM